MSYSKIKHCFENRLFTITLLLGFSSGLPLALSSSTLGAWFTTSGLSLKSIGFIGLASIPYTFKFLWAPAMDRWVPPLFGRRRGWMLICQLCLTLTLAIMAFLTPETDTQYLFMLACLLAFFSASQDIAVDAYRTDVLKPNERPIGAALFVNGYRIAMLVSASLPLILAEYISWKCAYLCMSAFMIVGILSTFMAPKPEMEIEPPKNFLECTVTPFLDFFNRPHAIMVLIFIVAYKLGDAFAGAMVQPFLIREIKFALVEIGTLVKFSGFLGTVSGTLLGGFLMSRMNYFHSLLLFGVLQMLANLAYWPLLWTGHNLGVAGSAIFLDNLCGGMGTVAFFALLMGLCNPRFTAFQYALFSALSAVGRVFVGPLAGRIAEVQGWESFFQASILFSLPGLLLLWGLRKGLDQMRETQTIHHEKQAATAPSA